MITITNILGQTDDGSEIIVVVVNGQLWKINAHDDQHINTQFLCIYMALVRAFHKILQILIVTQIS
jgi:hypothetical protein